LTGVLQRRPLVDATKEGDMGYEFECDKVIPGCEGMVYGETAEETLALAAEHAAGTHGLTDLDDATVEAVKAAIVPSNA
jgi:predicted small metal-binding protein